MTKELRVAILAGYFSVAAAQEDFDDLRQLIEGKQVRADGVILVEKDAAGQIQIRHTDGDLMSRMPPGLGARLKPGMAVILAIVPEADRLAVQRAEVTVAT